VAFFGCIYFAGLRPEEAINLGKNNLALPPGGRNEQTGEWEDAPGSDGWGEFEFGDASPDAGRDWTDDGGHREHRQLKHRAAGDTRTVPMHPELASLLREHVELFGYSQTVRCSRESGAGNCPPSSTGASGPPPGRRR
jgi:hypothetical protein